MSIDLIKENGFTVKKARSRRYPSETMKDADYTDYLTLLANTLAKAESLQHSLEKAARGIGLCVNANKTKHTCFKQKGGTSTFRGKYLKLVDQLTYPSSNILSTERNINIPLAEAWNAIDWLSIKWKSDLSDKLNAVALSLVLYDFIPWTLTKRMEKMLDGNQLHKNDTCYFEQILEAVPHKTSAVLPLISHLKNYSNKTNNIRGTLLEKLERTHYWLSLIEAPTSKILHHFCANSECSLEDMPRVINDRDGYRVRVMKLHAVSANR